MDNKTEDTRVALIGIMINDNSVSNSINDLLHQFSHCIIGRMGLPYSKKNLSIISIVIDASQDTINSLSGKLGEIKGIAVKTIYSKI